MKGNWLASFALKLGLAPALACTLAAGAPPARPQAPGGNKGTAPKAVQRLNRAPVNKEVLRVHLPRPSVHKLSNGMVVLVLEQHKLPTVTFAMWVKPGTLDDPKDLPGLASFTADMLREGTAKRTSAQIAAAVDGMGASLDASAEFGTSYTVVNASGLADSAESILDLMSDIVLRPAFPANELEKYKQRQLAGLERDRSQPGFLARERFYEVLYRDFPAAITSATPESIKGVTPEDLRRFRSRHYRPGNAILGVVGDVKTNDILKLLEKYFDAWTGGPEPGLGLPPVPAPLASEITLVDRPGSVQTNLLAGDLGVRRSDPDYVALAVMNRVVGGGPQARLFLNLREDKGYTYGAYSNFRADIYPGPWVARTEVRNSVTDASMFELMKELRRIRDEAVPQAELEEAERSRIAAFALSLERPRTLLDSWLEVRYYGLPEGLLGQLSRPHRRRHPRRRSGGSEEIRGPGSPASRRRRRCQTGEGHIGQVRPGRSLRHKRQAITREVSIDLGRYLGAHSRLKPLGREGPGQRSAAPPEARFPTPSQLGLEGLI